MLVRVHTLGNSIFFFFFFFWKQSVQYNHWYEGKWATKTGFLASNQQVWDFLRKKVQSCTRYIIFHRKRYIWTPYSLKKGHAPKNFFSGYFGKYCFFKKLLNENYSKPHFLQKSLYWFWSPDAPFASKWSCPPTNGFSQYPQSFLAQK